tara:strand:- start:44 stop:379 length:336 start_codon:yes stop_codon:yes gene_type:complete
MNIINVRPIKKLDKIKKVKAGAPGVPPNTCPYIDLSITMINDITDAYERLRTKGETNPVVDKIQTNAVEILEYVRSVNETLRDNSLFWYEQYKELDAKYKYHVTGNRKKRN